MKACAPYSRGIHRKKRLLDINTVIQEVLAAERGELQHHGVAVKVELTGATAQVWSDRLQVQQVILNLVVNAMEAMNSVTDRPRVLRLKSEVRESNQVLVTIEDSGVGIDRKNLDQIFEPFFTTKSRGMGLGLWMCRTIIENHDGQLTASSETNRGSVFQVVLPGRRAGAE